MLLRLIEVVPCMLQGVTFGFNKSAALLTNNNKPPGVIIYPWPWLQKHKVKDNVTLPAHRLIVLKRTRTGAEPGVEAQSKGPRHSSSTQVTCHKRTGTGAEVSAEAQSERLKSFLSTH